MSYMIYYDSLARMYGSPGSGKSFVALDLSLSLASGRFWGGRRVGPETVVYVMAEGQAVNGDRVEAWMSKNGVPEERLEGRFFAVPDAVMLTEYAARPFVEWVRENQPKLVVLDTKNAMMVGDENSASDFAAMRRTLDMIRKASGCCVLLIDHTGYEGTRARGSSAGTAAMDTEIKVTMDDSERPALITAEVTRDKAAEAGHSLAWRLMPEHPAAVLVPVDVPKTQAEKPEDRQWRNQTTPEQIPAFIKDMNPSAGRTYLADLARMMMFQTSMANDPDRHGVNLAGAKRDLKPHDPAGVGRAWSQLKDKGYLQSALEKPTEQQERFGHHVWTGPSSGSCGDQQ